MYNNESLNAASSSYVTIELPPRKASTMVSTTQAYKKGPRLTHTNSMVINRMKALPKFGGKPISSYFGEVIAPVFTLFLNMMQWFTVATLMFPGELEVKLPAILLSTILGTMVGQIVSSSISNYPSSIFQTSIESIPFIVPYAATVIKNDKLNLETKAATILCGLALENICVGVIALILSFLKMGKILHYLPGPVSSGAFAVVGWCLYQYSYNIAVGEDLSFDVFKHHKYYIFLLLNFSGLFLYLLCALRPRVYNFPIYLIVSTIIFHIVLAITGTSITRAQELEWLMEPPPSEMFYFFYQTINPAKCNWSHLFSNSLNLFLGSLMGPILNTGINTIVLDKLFQGRSNLDKVYRTLGINGIIGGVFGGMTCNLSCSGSGFHRACGGTKRLSTIVLCVLTAFLFFIPPIMSVVSYVPRFVLGSVFVNMGIDFLFSNLYYPLFNVSKLEYLIILVILIVSIFTSLTVGVVVGIILCFIVYIYNTAQSQFISIETDNLSMSSGVLHSLIDIVKIQKKSHHIAKYYQLNGYIFFAPSYDISDHISHDIETHNNDSNIPSISHVIIDFSKASGMDTTAISVFIDMTDSLLQDGINVIFVLVNLKKRTAILNQVKNKPGFAKETTAKFKIFPDPCEAMYYCENDLKTYGDAYNPVDYQQYTNQHLYKLSKLLRMLPRMADKMAMKVVLYCIREGLGKLIRVESGQIIYRKYTQSEGIFILCEGRMSAIIDNFDVMADERRSSVFNTLIHTTESNTIWTITSPGLMVGSIPERGFLSLHVETVITQEKTILYHLPFDSLLQLEKVSPERASMLYSWVKKSRLRIINYMHERVVYSKQYIKGSD